MLVRRAEMLPLECIVRGRLAGQAYDEYVATGTVHHMAVPAGMHLTDPFERADVHALDQGRVRSRPQHRPRRGGRHRGRRDGRARQRAVSRPLLARRGAPGAIADSILADTKFELGFVDGELVVCDEVLTPDSSRIWPADEVRPGEVPPVLRQAALSRLARRARAGTARRRRPRCPSRSWRVTSLRYVAPTSG